MTTRARRLGGWVASRRVGLAVAVDVLMWAYYVGLVVVGVLGLVRPSVSAEDALRDQTALVLWALIYLLAAPAGALARWRRFYATEGFALGAIALATMLHGAFLLVANAGGIQTGVRLLDGALACAALGLTRLQLNRHLTKAPPPSDPPPTPDELARLARDAVREAVRDRSTGAS